MNLETLNEKKKNILAQIEKDQEQIGLAIHDLGTSVNLSERVSSNYKVWLIGAAVLGFVTGQISHSKI